MFDSWKIGAKFGKVLFQAPKVGLEDLRAVVDFRMRPDHYFRKKFCSPLSLCGSDMKKPVEIRNKIVNH
jgi:hypothetical protein